MARAVVLRQLTGAPKSRKQLEDALTRKGCPDDVAAEVLDRFEQVGLVDDEAYAQAFVRSKQAGRGLARRALSHELRAKGVDDELGEVVVGAGDLLVLPDREQPVRRLVGKPFLGLARQELSLQRRHPASPGRACENKGNYLIYIGKCLRAPA